MKTGKAIAALSVAGVLAIGFIIYGAMNTVSAVSIKNNARTNSSTAAQSNENSSETNPNTSRYSRFGYGMMGGGCGGSYGYGDGSQSTVTESDVQNDTAAALQNATVDKKANTITYSGKDVKLVIEGGPEQADGKFVIGGLVNPTLVLPKAVDVTVEFVNEDEGMPHAFEITDAAPPYDYMSMMDGGVYPGSVIATLPKASDDRYAMATMTFQTNDAGTFYYICQYPGHAQNGMFGKLIVQ